jgi:hypothetical protein
MVCEEACVVVRDYATHHDTLLTTTYLGLLNIVEGIMTDKGKVNVDQGQLPSDVYLITQNLVELLQPDQYPFRRG